MSRTRPVTANYKVDMRTGDANPADDPPPLSSKIEVRLTDELKARAQAKASEKGITLSEQLRGALERWVES